MHVQIFIFVYIVLLRLGLKTFCVSDYKAFLKPFNSNYLRHQTGKKKINQFIFMLSKAIQKRQKVYAII